MGSIVTTLPEIGKELDIEVSLQDDDEPDAHYRLEVFSDIPGADPAKVPAKNRGGEWRYKRPLSRSMAFDIKGRVNMFFLRLRRRLSMASQIAPGQHPSGSRPPGPYRRFHSVVSG
jgi:hypothetical protein